MYHILLFGHYEIKLRNTFIYNKSFIEFIKDSQKLIINPSYLNIDNNNASLHLAVGMKLW